MMKRKLTRVRLKTRSQNSSLASSQLPASQRSSLRMRLTPLRVLKVQRPRKPLKRKLKNQKSINLKRILEKTPESMSARKKGRKMEEETRAISNVKEAIAEVRVVKVVVVAAEATRTRTWCTGPRLRTWSQ